MPSVDLFTIIEGFIAGVVAFFWSVVHSFYRLVRDPLESPAALLKRFQDKELRQVGPFTLLFLPWFLVFFVGGMSQDDWVEIGSRGAAETVSEYRAGSAFLHAFVGAAAATMVFDLWLRLFGARDTRGMGLTELQRSDYHALLRYMVVLPVLVLSVLTLAAFLVGTAVLRLELALFAIAQVVWLYASPRFSAFPAAGPRSGLRRLLPARYGVLTLLAFDISLACGVLASELSRSVEYQSSRAYPDSLYLEGLDQRCLVAGGRLAVEVTAFNPSSFAVLVPKTGYVDVRPIGGGGPDWMDDGAEAHPTRFAVQSEAKFAGGEIVGPKGLVTIAYRSTERIAAETVSAWQNDAGTHCWLTVSAGAPHKAMLFGEPVKFGPR